MKSVMSKSVLFGLVLTAVVATPELEAKSSTPPSVQRRVYQGECSTDPQEPTILNIWGIQMNNLPSLQVFVNSSYPTEGTFFNFTNFAVQEGRILIYCNGTATHYKLVLLK